MHPARLLRHSNSTLPAIVDIINDYEKGGASSEDLSNTAQNPDMNEFASNSLRVISGVGRTPQARCCTTLRHVEEIIS
jgi:hypothetical protein